MSSAYSDMDRCSVVAVGCPDACVMCIAWVSCADMYINCRAWHLYLCDIRDVMAYGCGEELILPIMEIIKICT